MKFIKKFESLSIPTLIPNQMYLTNFNPKDPYKTPVGYIENLETENNYFTMTCILFNVNPDTNKIKPTHFVQYAKYLNNLENFIPMNKTIEEYIIENNITRKTVNLFKFPIGLNSTSLAHNAIKKYYKKLINNEKIMNIYKIEQNNHKLKKDAKKYNL